MIVKGKKGGRGWLVDWSILQIKEPSRKMLELGARVLERAANEVYTAGQGWRINVARLPG